MEMAGGATRDVWVTNRMGAFEGGAGSTPVGSARRETVTISAREQKVFETEVLPGSTALLVRASTSDPGADVDVYLFDCTNDEGECRAARTDADPVGDESVMVPNPAAGTWKVVLDGASVPDGAATVEYVDAVLNPAYGMVSLVDVPQERDRDARWMAKAHVWLGGVAPEAGRSPFTALMVQGRATGDAAFLVGLTELKLNGAEVGADRW
jgi:hypothetical protein